MKNQKIILFPSRADDSIIRATPWVPDKTQVDSTGVFGIYRLNSDESFHKTIQYSIRSNEEDLLRMDVYAEDYFSIYWDGRISFRQFLEEVNVFLSGYKAELGSEPTLGIFTPYREPEFYGYELPLSESDFGKTILEKENVETSFVKIDSAVADFFYRPTDTHIGCMSYYDNTQLLNRVKRSLTHFIMKTQEMMPEEAITLVLSYLH